MPSGGYSMPVFGTYDADGNYIPANEPVYESQAAFDARMAREARTREILPRVIMQRVRFVSFIDSISHQEVSPVGFRDFYGKHYASVNGREYVSGGDVYHPRRRYVRNAESDSFEVWQQVDLSEEEAASLEGAEWLHVSNDFEKEGIEVLKSRWLPWLLHLLLESENEVICKAQWRGGLLGQITSVWLKESGYYKGQSDAIIRALREWEMSLPIKTPIYGRDVLVVLNVSV